MPAPTEPLVWIISPKPPKLCSAACHAPSLFTAAVDSKEGIFVHRDQGLHKLILLGRPDAHWHAAGLVAPLDAPLQRARPRVVSIPVGFIDQQEAPVEPRRANDVVLRRLFPAGGALSRPERRRAGGGGPRGSAAKDSRQ